MQGWRTPLTSEGFDDFPNEVVAVFFDKSFPAVEEAIEILRQSAPTTLFLVKLLDKVAINAVMQTDREYLVVKGNPFWKGTSWRETEWLNTCSKVVVFRDLKVAASKRWIDLLNDWATQRIWDSRLFVIERGKPKKKTQKKGKSRT